MIPIILLLGFVAIGVAVVRAAGWRFALKRFGQMVLVVFLVTFFTTWLLRQANVDEDIKESLVANGLSENAAPCQAALGTGATVERIEACVDDQGLDDPIFTQYVDWAGRMLRGDLGTANYKTGAPLSDRLKNQGPRTLLLFAYSQIIALGLAVPTAVWSAYQAGKPGRNFPPRWAPPLAVVVMLAIGLTVGWSVLAMVVIAVLIPLAVLRLYKGGTTADDTVNFMAFAFLSVPVFVTGLVLRFAFANHLSVYKLQGYVSTSEGIFSHLGSMWLPSLVLGLSGFPVYLRLLRADVMSNLQQDFVMVAKAKGMPNWWVLIRHVLRPSTLTLLTVAGLNIAQVVNGTLIVEFIYNLQGIGSLVIGSVQGSQLGPVQTMVALVSVAFIITNTLVDLGYNSIDPRVKVDDDR